VEVSTQRKRQTIAQEELPAELPSLRRTADPHRAAAPSTGHVHSDRYVWYVVFLFCVINVVAYIDRMALAVLAPLIKTEMRLSDAQLGLLTGFTFAIFFAVCALPVARWADRGIRRNIIALALTVWSAMTALSGAAQNFWHLFVARIGVGAGEAGCFPPQASMTCDYVPLKRRAGVFAITSFGLYAGTMVGMVLAGWLGEIIGWRLTFVVLGVPGLALALVVRLTLREPTRGAFDAVKDNQTPVSLPETFRFLWRCRTYRLLIVFLIANAFVTYGLNQWWPSFYTRVFGLSLSSVGVYLGIAIGSSSGIGLLAGGLLANKVASRDVKLPLVIGAISIALVLPAAIGSALVSSVWVSIFFVWLTGILLNAPGGPIAAAANSVVTSRMRATALAITILLSSVFGAGLGPVCVGLLSDMLTPWFGIDALRYALLVPLCLLPVMACALYAASKVLNADLAAAGARVDGGSPPLPPTRRSAVVGA
jgi:predicted MFS family arabinose efflux permease